MGCCRSTIGRGRKSDIGPQSPDCGNDYDSNDYGGSVGDNGHMARMKSAKDVTIEGVGTDAAMDG